ncbi:hypothetical protein AB0A74_29080 [Saccharothrix sp. NPDC042600]|uniref:hypothetical protein n=1 Tax=Saccharothrix TaxID=2071 RepID=UPI003410B5ED|nr:hypothetical protein GCM10017745_25290 [Saccharothrix mutabilis subsp. capreolus]
MNEHELKSALQDAMVASSPPPPMSAEGAVAAGRAAQRRRKTAWAGGVAGLAVVAIAVGAVLVPQLTGGGTTEVGGTPLTTGAPPPSVTPVSPTGPPPTSGSIDPSSTKTSWPDGQTDRTAHSGPRADKSVQALNDLGASLPPTYEAVDKQPLTPGDTPETWYGPMRYTQSQFDDYYDGDRQVWEYMGTSPVTQKGSSGVGKVWIMVLTKGNRFANVSSPCEAKRAVWPISRGDCRVVDVDGKQVGHLSAGPSGDDPSNINGMDEAAIYQHDDSTLVVIAQAREFRRSGHPALAELPFTGDQLAKLVTDEKFHLD